MLIPNDYASVVLQVAVVGCGSTEMPILDRNYRFRGLFSPKMFVVHFEIMVSQVIANCGRPIQNSVEYFYCKKSCYSSLVLGWL